MSGAANDVSDLEVNVIGDHAQVIGRAAVGTQEDEILKLAVGEFDFAEHRVIERGTATVWNSEPHRCSFTGRLSSQSFASIQLSASSFIPRRTAFLGGFGATALQFVPSVLTVTV